MLSTTSQLQFAAEFLAMLVAASGLALVALRPEVAAGRWRPLLLGGFVVIGVVAFLRGSLIVADRGAALGVVRLVGAALLAAGLPGWRAGARSRKALIVGAVGIGAGAAVEVARASGTVTDGILIAADLALGAALVVAARRSIAARVAASAAATLLLVVLVLSVALSSVISNSVENDRLLSLGTLAKVDAGAVAALDQPALDAATSLTAALDHRFPTGVAAISRGRVLASLVALASGYPGQSIGYLPAAGGTALGPKGSIALDLPASDVAVIDSTCTSGAQGNGAVLVIDNQLVAVGASPVCQLGGTAKYGTAIVVEPVQHSLLETQQRQQGVSVTIIGSSGILDTTSPMPPVGILRFANADVPPYRSGSRFVAIAAIPEAGVLLVVTSSTSGVFATQSSLFRTLFEIALGGTVLALGLAVVTGDRITGGLRRLTVVAQRIQEGSVSERAGVVGDDEVGALAGAFDSMVSAVEQQNFALRDAADTEVRLRGRLEAVVAGMGEALVAVDGAGRVTDFNRAAEELTGVRAAAAVGRPVASVVVLSGGDVGSSPAGLLDAGSALADLERSDGAVVPVAISLGPLRGPIGELGGTVMVLRDLRSELEVERMKTEFLSRVGHELRTPLTGILGYADILLRRDVPAERARQFHGEIVSSAKRQLRIIRLLEFFASSGAGRLALRAEPLDAGRLVQGVVAGWSGKVGPEHLLSVKVQRGVEPVLGDGRWLGLALDELIDNAVKFSPDGGRVVLRVAGDIEEDGVPMVEISVRDHGKGMTARERSHIFADFVQGDSSDTRSFGGLGLGLSFVKRVVESHGGSVECRSTPGRGSVFAVYLPAALDADAVAG